jgi:hypothetical protein
LFGEDKKSQISIIPLYEYNSKKRGNGKRKEANRG